MEVTREVPAQGEVAVPEELLVEHQLQVLVLQTLKVALLQLVVAAGHLGIERDALRQVVDTDGLGEVQPFRLTLEILERLPGLVDGRVAVVQRPPPLVILLVDGSLARGVTMGVTVGEREVRRIIGHGVTLGLQSPTEVREREVRRRRLRHGDVLDTVALPFAGRCLKGILQAHIRVEGIIAGAHLLLRHGVVDGCRDLRLVGEELAELERGGDGIFLLGVGAALHDILLQTTKAVANVTALQVDGSEVGELHIHRTRCCPAAVVIAVHESQLVHPHLTRLHIAGDITHTDHHHLHLAQRRISQHAYLVGRAVGIVFAIDLVERGGTRRLRQVTGFLQVGEDIEVHVEHIRRWPHHLAVGCGVFAVVAAVGGQLQRYQVLIVVVLVVATHTDEYRQLMILQVGGIGHQVVGVYEHLHVLILAEVEASIAIDGLRLTLLQVLHHHVERLLVALHKLWLRGVGDTADTWGQHIVHGLFVVALLDVHGTDLEHAAFRCRRVETLLVDAPLATDEVQGTEAQHDGLLESRHEHAHEADTGEVVDTALLVFILRDGDAELIPVHTRRIAVAELHAAGAHVGDEAVGRRHAVTVGIKHLGRDTHTILVVTLIFVEGEVLVDILLVRPRLVAGIIRLTLVIRVRRVALGIVDALVTVEDALSLFVEVRTPEIVVVVARRVLAPSLTDTVVGNLPAHGVYPVLVGTELLLLGIGQTVVAHILQVSRPAGGGEGVGLCGLYRNLSPLGGGKRV